MDSDLLAVVEKRVDKGDDWFITEYPTRCIVEKNITCCGLAVENIIRTFPCIVVTLSSILPAYCFGELQCAQCNTVYSVDGKSVGIINYLNRLAITVEAFHQLLKYKVNSGLPTHSWWKVKVL
jgi:hypothetical protein